MKLNAFQKELLKGAWAPIVFLIIFFSAYALLPNRGYLPLLFLMLSFSLGAKLFFNLRKKTTPVFKEYLKTASQVTLLVSIFSLLGKWLGSYGWLGAAALILIFVFYKLFRRWDLFLKGVRNIETELFGASLDKINWQGTKPKLPKLRVRGGKRK